MSAASDPSALLLVVADAEDIAALAGELRLCGDERSAWCLELCALGDFAVSARRMLPPISAKARAAWERALRVLLAAERSAIPCENGPPALPAEYRAQAAAWSSQPHPKARIGRSLPLRVTGRLADLYARGFGRHPTIQEHGRTLRFITAFHARLAALPLSPRYVAPTLHAERERLRQVLAGGWDCPPLRGVSPQGAHAGAALSVAADFAEGRC